MNDDARLKDVLLNAIRGRGCEELAKDLEGFKNSINNILFLDGFPFEVTDIRVTSVYYEIEVLVAGGNIKFMVFSIEHESDERAKRTNQDNGSRMGQFS